MMDNSLSADVDDSGGHKYWPRSTKQCVDCSRLPSGVRYQYRVHWIRLCFWCITGSAMLAERTMVWWNKQR